MTDDPRTSHPGFLQPEDPDAKVWRYMDLAKLVDFLHRRSLYYCQAARVGDAFECTLPEAMYERLQKENEAHRKSEGEQVVHEEFGDSVHARMSMYINCWCMPNQPGGDSESNALWKIYSGDRNGVAVVTSYRKLAEAIPDDDNVGLVRYIDFQDAEFNFSSLSAYVMHKRREYDYEHEVRIVRWKRPPMTPQCTVTKQQLAFAALRQVYSLDEIDVDWLAQQNPSGQHVEIDVDRLVEEIIVNPFAPAWYLDCIAAVVKSFGFEIPVRWSAMRATPRHHVRKWFGPLPGELEVMERQSGSPPAPDTYRSVSVQSWEPPPGRGLIIAHGDGATQHLHDANHAIQFADQPDCPDMDRALQELLRYLLASDPQLERLADVVGKTFDIVRRSRDGHE